MFTDLVIIRSWNVLRGPDKFEAFTTVYSSKRTYIHGTILWLSWMSHFYIQRDWKNSLTFSMFYLRMSFKHVLWLPKKTTEHSHLRHFKSKLSCSNHYNDRIKLQKPQKQVIADGHLIAWLITCVIAWTFYQIHITHQINDRVSSIDSIFVGVAFIVIIMVKQLIRLAWHFHNSRAVCLSYINRDIHIFANILKAIDLYINVGRI